MNRKNICILICVLFSLGTSAYGNMVLERATDIEIITAMNRYICFDSFWNGNNNYRMGETVKLAINKNKGYVYIWVENLETQSFMPSNAAFIQFKYADNMLMPVTTDFFNQNALTHDQALKSKKSIVFSEQMEELDFNIPANCPLKFIKNDELKTRVLTNIKRSIVEELIQLNELNEKPRYGTKTEVVIANFDLDYPQTFAYLPATDEVLEIKLNSSPEAYVDTYLIEKEFPIGPINNEAWAKSLKPLIQANSLFKGPLSMSTTKRGNGVRLRRPG